MTYRDCVIGVIGVVLALISTSVYADPLKERVFIREIQSNNKDMIVMRYADNRLYRFRMSVGCLPLLVHDDKGNRLPFSGDGDLVSLGANPFYNMGEGTIGASAAGSSVIHPVLHVTAPHLRGQDLSCQIIRIQRYNPEFQDMGGGDGGDGEILTVE